MAIIAALVAVEPADGREAAISAADSESARGPPGGDALYRDAAAVARASSGVGAGAGGGAGAGAGAEAVADTDAGRHLDAAAARKQVDTLRSIADGAATLEPRAVTFGAEDALLAAIGHADVEVARYGAVAFAKLADCAPYALLAFLDASDALRPIAPALWLHEADFECASLMCHGFAELQRAFFSQMPVPAAHDELLSLMPPLGVFSGCIAALRRFSSHCDLSLTRDCLHLLCSATGGFTAECEDIVHLKGLGGLLGPAFKLHGEDEDVAESCCTLLQALARKNSPDDPQELLAAGGADALAELLRPHRVASFSSYNVGCLTDAVRFLARSPVLVNALLAARVHEFLAASIERVLSRLQVPAGERVGWEPCAKLGAVTGAMVELLKIDDADCRSRLGCAVVPLWHLLEASRPVYPWRDTPDLALSALAQLVRDPACHVRFFEPQDKPPAIAVLKTMLISRDTSADLAAAPLRSIYRASSAIAESWTRRSCCAACVKQCRGSPCVLPNSLHFGCDC